MQQPISHGDFEAALDRAADLLRSAERVAVLTGPGLSEESGVPTCCDQTGLWEGKRVEGLRTRHLFQSDPGLVWRYYNARRAALGKVRLNPGHFALKTLEDRLGLDRFALITRNVDGRTRPPATGMWWSCAAAWHGCAGRVASA
jgi:NAD-dependent deacetylase